jgi:hypothetical protein
VKRIAWILSISVILLFVSGAFIPCVGGDDDDEEGPPEYVTLDWGRMIGFMEDDGNVTFDSKALDVGRDEDGNFLILARGRSNTTMELILTTKQGKSLWNDRFDYWYNKTELNSSNINEIWHSRHERWTGHRIIDITNGEYLLQGWHSVTIFNKPIYNSINDTYSFENGSRISSKTSNACFFIVNETGYILWEEAIPSKYYEIFDIVKIENGNYLLMWTNESWEQDWWVDRDNHATNPLILSEIKINRSIEEIWTSTIHEDYQCRGSTIFQDSNGDYIVGANRYIEGEPNFWLIKVDTEGEVKWSKIYIKEGCSTVKDIIELSDGYVVSSYASPSGFQKVTVIKIDFEGKQQWRNDYSKQYIGVKSLASDSGDDVLLFCNRITGDNWDFTIIKINNTGGDVWSVTYEIKGYNVTAKEMFDNGDGTYYVISEGYNLFLLKTNEDPTKDTDHDGFYDPWEYETFGNLEQTPDSDADGDGFSNQREIDEGTDPTDEYDYPGQEEAVYIILGVMSGVLVLILIIVIYYLLRGKKEKEEEETEKKKDEPQEKKPEAEVEKPEDDKSA